MELNTLKPAVEIRRNIEQLNHAIDAINSVVLGKQTEVRLAITCLLAGGHLLIEDVPGVGKTTLAHTLARVLGLDFQRVQFTSDLLPADIIGANIFYRESGEFRFQPGPVFTQLVLADEVNRATPKTQSALLEAMEEKQVTVDGVTRPLPEPFFVIATQNPQHQIGTFPLPESQLDRFLIRLALGYPDHVAERELLEGRDRRSMLNELKPSITAGQLLELQQNVQDIITTAPLLDYIQALVQYTRESDKLDGGLSPRAALAIRRAAQAWAMLDNRNAVIPEDVQAVFAGVVSHRLHQRDDSTDNRRTALAREILEAVPIP